MDRISRRQAVRGAGAAAAMMLGSPSVHAQNGRQTLRFVAQADLKILDPIWTTAYITRNQVPSARVVMFETCTQSPTSCSLILFC